MTPADEWAELEALAKGATPGPRLFSERHDTGFSVLAEVSNWLVTVPVEEHDYNDMGQCRKDAAFIAAANPAAILKLIEAARQSAPHQATPPLASSSPGTDGEAGSAQK